MSKDAVVSVLGPKATKDVWSTAYRPVLPVTPQDFALGGVLPAVLYMMRWAQRRGQGEFAKTYGQRTAEGGKLVATIAGVASELIRDDVRLRGFTGDVEKTILGDLLLAFCLENKKHATGREQQIQRAFPTHYFSSWIDLPETVANLRGVPEMIVAILARQERGESLQRGGKGHFAVGSDFSDNLLLSLFGLGTKVYGQPDSLGSDKFDEGVAVGLDQLLTIRLAQRLGSAPQKMRGASAEIPNQLPLAIKAADDFREDLNIFLRAYSHVIPRQSLLPMLESCLGVGLSAVYLSTFGILLEWSTNGRLLVEEEQAPWPLFVDCSAAVDQDLRRVSEECMDDLVRRLARLPVWMMCLRILDQQCSSLGLRDLPPAAPNPTERIRYLGELIWEGSSENARDLERDLRRTCGRLADALGDQPEVNELLLSESLHPAWRLAEALVLLMGEKQQFGEYRKHLDSCLMVNEANGLSRKRRTTLRGTLVDRRSIVLSNTALDYLAHRHLRKAKRGTGVATLSLAQFLAVLHDRHGFLVDEAPHGMSVSSDLLRRNRAYLERRLRDMGLLLGVNDAESMKRLVPRFEGSA